MFRICKSVATNIRRRPFDFVRRYPAPSEDRIVFFDTTLRDGEQSPGCTLTVDEKVAIARQLSLLGVDVCEAGFPISSDGDFLAVKTIAQEIGPLTHQRQDGIPMRICGLSRATEKDIHRCYEAVRHAPLHRIHTFLATSELHLKYKLQISRQECIKRAAAAVAYARSLVDDVEFSPEDAGRSDPEFLCDVLGAVIEAGATTLNIPDTVGYNTPDAYEQTLKYLISNTKGGDKVTWSTHCHNDLGLATANTFAGIRAGARQAEVTINGIGERAGNTSLEELAMILFVHRSKFGFKDRINRHQITRTSQMVTAYTGMVVQPNKAIVGANAFAHESGIHQDGVLKHRETYEIIHPATIGLGSNQLILGKHSGMNAFSSRLSELGFSDIPADQMKIIFQRFKTLADRKKEVNDFDLRALINDELNQPKDIWKLENVHVSTGNHMVSSATCTMIEGENKIVDAATGNGPVDAIFNCISRITKQNPSLADFEVKAITSGSDSLGEVRVWLADSNEEVAESRLEGQRRGYYGHGADTDILVASAKAYTNAINRLISAKRVGHPEFKTPPPPPLKTPSTKVSPPQSEYIVITKPVNQRKPISMYV